MIKLTLKQYRDIREAWACYCKGFLIMGKQPPPDPADVDDAIKILLEKNCLTFTSEAKNEN